LWVKADLAVMTDHAGDIIAGALGSAGVDEGLPQQQGMAKGDRPILLCRRRSLRASTREARLGMCQSGRIRKRLLLASRCRG